MVGVCAGPTMALKPGTEGLLSIYPWTIREVPEGEGGLDLACGITTDQVVGGTPVTGGSRGWEACR